MPGAIHIVALEAGMLDYFWVNIDDVKVRLFPRSDFTLVVCPKVNTLINTPECFEARRRTAGWHYEAFRFWRCRLFRTVLLDFVVRLLTGWRSHNIAEWAANAR